ncbi:MAG: DarT ssDNA thymidine ADP-ribosyltransferase family protein [Candidatus Thermoplasmatota archaeon]|nr:DarT ssDNA thymidine ADP-ribosyltransferase family protein [Candidatus Thermoplasmatota archaeon]
MLNIIANPLGKLNRLKGEYSYAYYFYHFTDIKNIQSILEHEHLYSRIKCEKLGIPISDSASHQIIDDTETYKKEFVRLNFRPRTPMQYHIEGFVPVGRRWKDAHCPIPVFLLFDSMSLLKKREVQFSDGNFAAKGSRPLDKKSFVSLPFEKIYSTGPHDRSDFSTKYHRQAEILFKDSLPLDPLRFIVCRSRAEHSMLQYQLMRNGLQEWSEKVVLLPIMKLFYSQRLFVKEVFLADNYAYISFNTSMIMHRVSFRIKNIITSEIYRDSFDYSRDRIIEIENKFFRMGDFHIVIEIDGIKAYEAEIKIN